MEISLALGGGGARGNAHIGVLRVLEQESFQVKAISGTSIGGIVAALYASGYSPDEIEKIFTEVDQTKLYGRTEDDGPALLGTEGVRKFLAKSIGERTFADLKIPCAMSAADLGCGCEVVLKTGFVKDAILATIAVPGIFPPQKIGSYELVDGGIVNPVPVSVARALKPGLPVVAVTLSPSQPTHTHLLNVTIPSIIPAPLADRIVNLRITQALKIFMQSVEIGQQVVTELQLRLDKPDVLIRPAVDQIGLLDHVDVHEVVALGEIATRSALSDIKQVTDWTYRLRRKMFGAQA